MEKVASSAPAVAVAQAAEGGIVIVAKAPGAATVRAWKKGAAQPELITVQVDATGWALVTVVVAARDIDEGSTLTAEDLATASLPEAVVTTSLVRSDASARVLGHKTAMPIQAGDALWWAALQPTGR